MTESQVRLLDSKERSKILLCPSVSPLRSSHHHVRAFQCKSFNCGNMRNPSRWDPIPKTFQSSPLSTSLGVEGCDSCKKSWDAVHGSNGLWVKPSMYRSWVKDSQYVRDGHGSSNRSADDDYNIFLHCWGYTWYRYIRIYIYICIKNNTYDNDNTDSRTILTMAIASLAQTLPRTATATQLATCPTLQASGSRLCNPILGSIHVCLAVILIYLKINLEFVIHLS